MQTKQTITIIGAAGVMGSAISKSLSKGNYRILLEGNDGSKLQELAESIRTSTPTADVEVIDCTYNGCWEADIIIPAIPFEAEKEVGERIRPVATQKIVVSIANPFNNTFDGLLTPPGTSAAEELQKLLPHSKVVKAFNTTFAADFANPELNGTQLDCFIAGNDESAIQTVSELVATAGFNAVYTGDLLSSRTLEQMQLLLIQLNNRYQYKSRAGWKIVH